MAIGVDDLFPGEDPVGDDEVLDHCIEIAHCADSPLSLGGSMTLTLRRRRVQG
jgi:hypothetical protein